MNTRTGLRHRMVMMLLYDSGCRVQELCDLRIKDINTGALHSCFMAKAINTGPLRYLRMQQNLSQSTWTGRETFFL
ncbi:tyrosine-type recombinase/integrase [Hungatella hathewayi]|uniref:tyrosine-type recombinase/integrase n=1 Tax=Hungatella hathewayi TaxID=154046 RepID=UPI003568206D